jgi:tryptophan synthase alpha chain
MKATGQKALIPFLTAGDPHIEVTEALMATLAENGADIIELGVPYSDPLADGPVLQAAALRALAAGTTPDDVFALVSRFKEKYDTPVILLVYYNLVYRRGVELFCRDAAAAGVTGLVVPDLPYEEADMLDVAAINHHMVNIRFLSPTTTDDRLVKICKSAAGFIYCVTVTGVTGQRVSVDPALENLLLRARNITDVPLALGFGISTPKQASDAAKTADAVIVGSALVKVIVDMDGVNGKRRAAGEFIRSLKVAMIEGV